ncbi:MAG: helix-turn-helix transcriptional regulator [Ruminococcus sp.]|nr:helix-turn-helix transcriptional regulator [Ruminococcus sp.]
MNRKELTIEIGMNIRKYRIQADLSQESLSLSANLLQAYIGKLERGERCPNIETLYKISKCLNVPVCDLLDFDDLKSYSDEKLECNIEAKIKLLSQKQLNILAQVMDILSEYFK